MNLAVEGALDKIVRVRLTEYEQERPSLLNSLKRHRHVISLALGGKEGALEAGWAVALPAAMVAGAAAIGGVTGAPFAGAAFLAGAGVTIAGVMAPFVAKDAQRNQRDWAEDMRMLNELMVFTRGGDRDFSPDRMRKLARMGWIERKLSNVPKDVFKVADQAAKIEGSTYEGIPSDPAKRAPTQMIQDAQDRRHEALRENLIALNKVNALWPETAIPGPLKRGPSM